MPGTKKIQGLITAVIQDEFKVHGSTVTGKLYIKIMHFARQETAPIPSAVGLTLLPD